DVVEDVDRPDPVRACCPGHRADYTRPGSRESARAGPSTREGGIPPLDPRSPRRGSGAAVSCVERQVSILQSDGVSWMRDEPSPNPRAPGRHRLPLVLPPPRPRPFIVCVSFCSLLAPGQGVAVPYVESFESPTWPGPEWTITISNPAF